jgi:hypothetical protein
MKLKFPYKKTSIIILVAFQNWMTLILQKYLKQRISFEWKGIFFFDFLKCWKENHHFRISMFLAKKFVLFFFWIQGTPCKKIGFKIYFHILNRSLNSIVRIFDIFKHCQHLINLHNIFTGGGRKRREELILIFNWKLHD